MYLVIIVSLLCMTFFYVFSLGFCVLFCCTIQKEAAVEKAAEEPKGFKVGKGKIPEKVDNKDSATLRPVIIEPEVSKCV